MGELARALAAEDADEGAPGSLTHLPGPAAPGSPFLLDRTGPVPAMPPSIKLAALAELQDLVESAHNAKDLFVIGGFEPVLACLAARESGIRTAAAAVIATVVQNNPTAQAWALDAAALPALHAALSRAISEAPSTERYSLIAALITALSCLVRDSAEGQSALFAATSGAEDMLLMPVREYVRLRGDSQSAAPALLRASARCARKSLFALTHLLRGSYAAAAADIAVLTALETLRDAAFPPAAHGAASAAAGQRDGAPDAIDPSAAREAAAALISSDTISADYREIRSLASGVLATLSTALAPEPAISHEVEDDRRRRVTGGIALATARSGGRNGPPAMIAPAPALSDALETQPAALEARRVSEAVAVASARANQLSSSSSSSAIVLRPTPADDSSETVRLERRLMAMRHSSLALARAVRCHHVVCVAAAVSCRAAASRADAGDDTASSDADAYTDEASSARALLVEITRS